MTELAMSREVISQITGTEGRPQVLIRIGRSPANERPGLPTPRLAVDDVLEFRTPAERKE